MPLPSVELHGAARCTARSRRTGERCKNPSAFSSTTCRYHGARRPESVPRGIRHWNYKNGAETLVAKGARSTKLAELRNLESTLVAQGLLTGPRWRGRKPAGQGTRLKQDET